MFDKYQYFLNIFTYGAPQSMAYSIFLHGATQAALQSDCFMKMTSRTVTEERYVVKVLYKRLSQTTRERTSEGMLGQGQSSSIKPYKGHDSTCTTHAGKVTYKHDTQQKCPAHSSLFREWWQHTPKARTTAFHKVCLSTDTGAYLMAQCYRA